MPPSPLSSGDISKHQPDLLEAKIRQTDSVGCCNAQNAMLLCNIHASKPGGNGYVLVIGTTRAGED
jgi:hypothetical protein